jgi:hypothetical protein
MWLLVAVFSLGLALTGLYIIHHVRFYVWFFTALLYGICYLWLDDGEVAGHRSWNRARALALWRRLLPLAVSDTGSRDKIAACMQQEGQAVLFIVVNACSMLPLWYGFGHLPRWGRVSEIV